MDNRDFQTCLEEADTECHGLWHTRQFAYPEVYDTAETSSDYFTSDENNPRSLMLKPGRSAYAAIQDLFQQTTTLTCIMRQQLVLLRSLWHFLPENLFNIYFAKLVIIDSQLEAWLPVHGYQLPVRSMHANTTPNPLTWFFKNVPASDKQPRQAGDIITFFNHKDFPTHLETYLSQCTEENQQPDIDIFLGRYNATLALSPTELSTANQGTLSEAEVRSGLAEKMQTIRPPSAKDLPPQERTHHSCINTKKIVCDHSHGTEAFQQWFQQIENLSRCMKHARRPTLAEEKKLKQSCPKHTKAIKGSYNNEDFISGYEAYCCLIIAQQKELLQTQNPKSLRTLCDTLLTFAAHCRYAYQLHAATMLYQAANHISQELPQTPSSHREKINRRLHAHQNLMLFKALNTPRGQQDLNNLCQLTQMENMETEVGKILSKPPFNGVCRNKGLFDKLNDYLGAAEKGGENEETFYKRLSNECNALLRRELLGITDESFETINKEKAEDNAEQKAEEKKHTPAAAAATPPAAPPAAAAAPPAAPASPTPTAALTTR
jgi:hypothetical protein